MMASKPHRLFEILWRLRHPSGQSLYDFKEMVMMLTYLAAVLGLFWLMGKISGAPPVHMIKLSETREITPYL
jgi:hypothetical protein